VSTEASELERQVDHLLDVGRVGDAQRAVGRLLQLQPQDPEALFLAARVAYEGGDLIEARARVADVLERNPTHEGARLVLFDVEMKAERFAQAEAVILELLRSDPDDARLLAIYGRLMLRVYQLDKARSLVNEALKREPEMTLALALDALLHIIHGDDARASERLGQLIADDPEAEHVAWLALAVMESQGRHREMLEIARQLLRTQPGNKELVDLVIGAAVAGHWSLKPLWPVLKFGWGGSIALWVIGVAGLRFLRGKVSDPVLGVLTTAYLLYVVYSWVWPPLLRRWLRRRGV
jgi:tetratricopeptide (TPR) repeat protein